ncbi:MAG: polyisoprenoid-binding protein [Betaproteobacteria bacterium]|nr:polyisoprenoid-binding protein [Betaproteobacteria bacterium]
MQRSLFALALAAVITVPAMAADTYITDPNHTFARFSYSHLGYSTQLSRFDKVSGKIILDTAAKTGSVDITIDTRSANTGSAKFDEHIQGEDFLDTGAFPTATFKSNTIKFKGDTPDELIGDLTLKGITKPVVLKITSYKCMPHPMIKKDACGADAVTHVKRTDFNMGKFAPYVGDDVTITVSVEAIKQ